MKGIPWTAAKLDIIDFFSDLHIMNGTNGIHFKIDNTFNNDAFIQLASYEDVQLALKRKMRYFANSAVKSKISDKFSRLKFWLVTNFELYL